MSKEVLYLYTRRGGKPFTRPTRGPWRSRPAGPDVDSLANVIRRLRREVTVAWGAGSGGRGARGATDEIAGPASRGQHNRPPAATVVGASTPPAALDEPIPAPRSPRATPAPVEATADTVLSTALRLP